MPEFLVARYRATYDIWAIQVGDHSIGTKISFAELFTNTGRLQLICLWRQTFLRFSVRAEIYDLSRDQPRIGPYRPRAGGIWGMGDNQPSTGAR